MKHNYLKHLFTALLLLCATVVTAHDFEVGGIYYNILSKTDKTVEVTCKGSSYSHYSNEYSGSVVIPESVIYDGITYRVTSIEYNAFSYCSGLTSVVIANSVTSIEYLAFDNCTGLTSVEIGNSVTSIGTSAFNACKKLTEIKIPNNVTSIGECAFSYCYGLTSIEIGTCIGNKDSVTSIGNSAFYGCTGLTSVVFGNNVTSIGNYVFSGCTSLESVKILSSATNIGNEVFGGSSPKKVELNCDTISRWLSRNTSIEEIIIGNSVTSIGEDAFYECTGLTSVEIPNSVTSIGSEAFRGCSGLTSVVIGNSVTSIGSSAFKSCTGLTSVEIPNSVTSIGSDAFDYCTNLKTVINFSNITFSKGSSSNGDIAYNANKVFNAPNGFIDGDFVWFENEDGMTLAGYLGDATELTLPVDYNGKNVTSIGNDAFYGCTGLTSIGIPNSVTSIGDEAFYGCIALKTVINNSNLNIEKGSISNGYVAYYADEVIMSEFKFELIDGVYTLVKYRGNGTKQEEVTTFDSWTSTNQGQSGSTSSHKYKFDAIVGSKLSFDWSVSSEANYDKFYVILDGTTVLTKSGIESGNYEYTFTVAGSHTLEVEYTKDGSVDRNNDDAKIYNVKLARTINKPGDVVLPDNYEGESYVIGESAFENNEYVASVTIPEGIEMICYKAFSGCSNLENIVIPNSMSAIGGDAFAGTKWYDNKEDGMVYIGNVLYKYKGSMPDNTAITINDGTLGVAGLAFANCTGLTSITSLIPADNLFVPGSDAFVGVDKTNCTLYVPYGAKETYAATEGWEDFENIVEIIPAEITITINQYGCATFCSDLALDFSNVEGLKVYAATGYKSNSQVVTLTRVQTAEAGIGLFLKGEPGEYVVPVIESTDEHSLNMLVGTLEPTIVNSADGAMSNYKFTIAEGDASPMFYPFEDNTTLSAGKAYLQIPTAWLPATAQKSLNIRFDEGETTDIDEMKEQRAESKDVYYDLSGRVVENPTNGIYIIDGKKTLVK